MGEMRTVKLNKAYRFISICLELADLADEKEQTPFNDDLRMGFRAFSGYMRSGVKELIDLKHDYYRAISSEKIAKESEEEARYFLQECFGDGDIDSINDADKERILALCNKIRQEWEEKEEE